MSTAVALFEIYRTLPKKTQKEFKNLIGDNEGGYNPEFVAKIKEGEKQFKEGKYKTVSLDDIWKLD